MSSVNPFLFVYGSLLSHQNGKHHPLLQDTSTLIAQATIPGLLYEVAGYPAITLITSTHIPIVLGELYQLHNPSQLLSALDDYEECSGLFAQPHEYLRQQAHITLSDTNSTLLAWVYVYNRPTNQLQRIHSGDYRSYQ